MAATTAPSDRSVLRLRPEATDRLEALLSSGGPHLVDVLDIGTATNGDLLLVLPEPAARLAELAAAPSGLTAGEAVTVLVPLAQALQHLHASGVAHGGVGVDAVVLDADGSPAWTAPPAPVLLRRAGPARFTAQAAADVAAFRVLSAALLRPSALAVPEGDEPEVLARGLYALAAAEPVRLVRPIDPAPVLTPSRLLPAVPPVPLDPAAGRAKVLIAGALTAARGVRPRAWVALGGAAVLLVAALVALPSGDDGAPAATRAASRPSRSTAEPAPLPTEVAGRGLRGADALTALLQARERCLTLGSEACLRRVDAAGSPVLQADLDAVRAGADAVRVDRRRLRAPVSSGGTVLATSDRASVLAVREQNGWRLRDVVAEPPAVR